MLRALALALLVGSLPAEAGRKKKEAEAQLADPFSPESLEAFRREIVPLVEKAGGRTFDAPVAVELTDADHFGQVVSRETKLIFDQVYRASPPELRERLAEQSGAPAGLLGKYAIFENTLFLNQDGITMATKAAGLPTHRIPDVIRVILAHEMAHGLHDDESDLERLVRGLDDLDALRAASGTWEGLATWIEEQVAEELGLLDVYDELIELQGWSRTGDREPEAYPVWALYGVGRDFMTALYAEGGHDRVWEVATTPPTRSAVVFRPHTYGTGDPAPPLDYARVLEGTEQKLTKGDWLLANTRLGEFDLRGDAVAAGQGSELDEVLAHLEAARMLSCQRSDRSGEIRVLDFGDATWADRYLTLLKEQETARSTALATRMGTPVEVSYAPYDAVTADDATLRFVKLPDVGGVRLERHQAWVRRGDTVVVVSADNFRPGLRLGWTVEAVFERLEQARAGTLTP